MTKRIEEIAIFDWDDRCIGMLIYAIFQIRHFVYHNFHSRFAHEMLLND